MSLTLAIVDFIFSKSSRVYAVSGPILFSGFIGVVVFLVGELIHNELVNEKFLRCEFRWEVVRYPVSLNRVFRAAICNNKLIFQFELRILKLKLNEKIKPNFSLQ